MMRVIHKIPITPPDDPTPTREVQLPAGAAVVDFEAQGPVLTAWVLLNPEAPASEWRTFRVYATGEPIRDGARYLHTCHVDGYVRHLFEEPRS